MEGRSEGWQSGRKEVRNDGRDGTMEERRHGSKESVGQGVGRLQAQDALSLKQDPRQLEAPHQE